MWNRISEHVFRFPIDSVEKRTRNISVSIKLIHFLCFPFQLVSENYVYLQVGFQFLSYEKREDVPGYTAESLFGKSTIKKIEKMLKKCFGYTKVLTEKKTKKQKKKPTIFNGIFRIFSGMDLCQPNSSGCAKTNSLLYFHTKDEITVSPLPRLFHHCGWSNLNPKLRTVNFFLRKIKTNKQRQKGKNSNPLLKKDLYISIYRDISIFLLVWHCKSLEFQ